MKHVLDNPAWNALISGNKHLSYGNDAVKYFDKPVSPFAAFRENTAENFRALYELLPHNGPVLFVAPAEINIPGEWQALRTIRGFQMVQHQPEAGKVWPDLVNLTPENVAEMVDLARLTNPGPFESRTIDFGHYKGVFEGDKLVAMAGQRLHPFQYAEVSAVCTHPDHTGKGYARKLLMDQVHRIRAAGEIPFLHVRDDNDRAIAVYENLGFEKRIEVYFYVIVKVQKQ